MGKLFLMHIPKAAGISLEHDVRELVGLRNFESHEMCYSFASEMRADSVAVMLRNPRSHVLSMYNHCTASAFADKFSNRPDLPRSFSGWARKWVEMKHQGVFPQGRSGPARSMPLQCYNPINMQTHRLACRGHFPNNYSAELASEVGHQTAVQNLRRAWAVGIAEAYRESICLMHVKACGALPEQCACDGGNSSAAGLQGAAPEVTLAVHHIDHGVGLRHNRASLGGLPPAALRDVDELTEVDRQVYNAAVDIFLRDVRQAEQAHGRRMLCREVPRA